MLQYIHTLMLIHFNQIYKHLKQQEESLLKISNNCAKAALGK